MLSSFRSSLVSLAFAAACSCESVERPVDGGVDAATDSGPLVEVPPDLWLPENWHLLPFGPDLPERPAWEYAPSPLGEPDAESALCNRDNGIPTAVQLVVRGSDVHALVMVANNQLSEDPWSNWPSSLSIHSFHEGVWTNRMRAPHGPSILEAALDARSSGDLFFVAPWIGCGVSSIGPAPFDPRDVVCFRPGIAEEDGLVWTVSSGWGHLAVTTDHGFYVFVGDTFVELPVVSAHFADPSHEAKSVSFLDDDYVVLTSAWISSNPERTFVYDRRSDELVELTTDLPVGASSVVRLPDGDLVFPLGSGRAYYDGDSVELVVDDAWPVGHVVRFLEHEGVVYYVGPSGFGTFVDGVATELFAPTGYERSIVSSAVGPDGIYLAVVDDTYYAYRCGGVFVLRFDGSEFHFL